MALSKNITLSNGVSTNYHRVVSYNTIINIGTIIEIASYTSQAKREEEKVAIAEGAEYDVFIYSRFETAPYEIGGTMDDAAAYEWIKTNVEDFEGAEDA